MKNYCLTVSQDCDVTDTCVSHLLCMRYCYASIDLLFLQDLMALLVHYADDTRLRNDVIR